MKKAIQVLEVENEGLITFLGKRIFIVCESFFYDGILEGVNETCLKLDDAYFVLESGDFTKKGIALSEKIQGSVYVNLSKIESFFPSHR